MDRSASSAVASASLHPLTPLPPPRSKPPPNRAKLSPHGLVAPAQRVPPTATHGAAAIDLLELIDRLEETVLSGRAGRFGGGWTVNRDELLDVIDRMRSAVPREVDEARTVLRDRHQILTQADEEALIIVNKAREETEHLLNSHDLVLEAQRRAAAVIDTATREARDTLDTVRKEAAAIRGDATTQAVEQALEADRYSLDMLRRLEAQLTSIDSSVRAGIDQLDQKIQREQELAAVDARDAEIIADREQRAPV